MRAREFTINIPINIKINGDGEPEVDMEEPVDDDTGDFVPPLQQKIELLKKSSGVKSIYDDGGANQKKNTLKHLASDDDPLE